MRNRLTDTERQVRAALDGRVAFACAAVALAAGLILLLDRIGLPDAAAKWLTILVAAAALALIGALARAARISTFYVAERGIPASYAGLALAAVTAGMALAFRPPLPAGAPGFALLLGLTLGGVGLLAFSAPLIRKSGAFSAADLVAGRFPSFVTRVALVGLAAVICALAALAGFEQAVRLLAGQLDVARGVAAALTGVILFLVLAPGGLRGLTWTSAAGGGMALAALAAPVLLLAAQDIPLPAPVIGSSEAWSHAAERIAAWTGLAPGAGDLWLALPVALGIAGFAPLIAICAACRDRVGAQFAVGAGAVWMLLILFFAAMTAALAAIGLDVALIGQRADRLADLFYRLSADGWISICGGKIPGPAEARAACAAAPGLLLRPQDIGATMNFLSFDLADAQGMSGAWRAFALAGAFAVSLALAAAGLQGAATALGHDLLYRMRDRAVITSRRLATTRLMLVAAIVLAAVATTRFSPDPRLCLGLALTISAAGMTPLLALSLWPRAGSAEAILALLAGAGVAYGLAHDSIQKGAALPEALGLAALAGAGAALATGFIISLRPGGSREDGAGFRDRMTRAGADALTPDRGA